jgi:hypothetical protein
MSPSTAIRRRPGATGRLGEEVEGGGDADRRCVVGVVDDRRPDAPSWTAMRCAAELPASSAAATSSSGSPSHSATAAAASAWGTRCRPGVALWRRRTPHGAWSVNSVPTTPRLTISSARTSAAGPSPKVQVVAAVTSRMAATRASSALRTARPSRGRASGSSALARAIRSRLPARSRWVGWTASTTPTSGRAISARRAISPTVYMLISRTATSCSGSRRSRVSGRPDSEFRFPSLRSVRNVRASTSAVISLASVLPVEPVMPTTRTAWRERHHAASSCRATSASGTTTMAASRSGGSSSGVSTRATAAPARTASTTWRWPSVRSPRSATKREPGGTRRESRVASRKLVTEVDPESRPPTAASSSSRRMVGGTGTTLRTTGESSSLMAARPGPPGGPVRWPGSRSPAA